MGIAVLAVLEGAHLTNWTGLAEPMVTSANSVRQAAASPQTKPADSQRIDEASVAGAADRPVKVFILAGDSNMAGRAKVALLKYQANQAETKERFQHLLHDGEWVVREDVWIKNFKQKGNLTVGFGQEPDRFGPELEFGNVVGDHFDEQVLLIKTCLGWKLRLNRDFRSPSSGLPPQEVLEQLRKELQKCERQCHACRCGTELRRPVSGDAEGGSGDVGQPRRAFSQLPGPGLRDRGVRVVSGMERHARTANPLLRGAPGTFHSRRESRLQDAQSSVRHRSDWVSSGGSEPGTNDANFRAAQAAVAQLPEFTGNVKLVATDPFWDHEAHAVFKKGWQNHHGRMGQSRLRCMHIATWAAPRRSAQIGKAFGEAMIELRRSGAKN